MKLKLEEAMEAIIDYRGKTPTKTLHGVPLITAKIVKGGRIEEPEEFIAVEDYDDWMRRGLPKPGDVLVTTEAPLGEVARLGDRRVALAQRLICLRGKFGLLDNGYLKYLLMSRPIQNQLRSRKSGSTVSGIKQSELRKIELDLPPLSEQQRIAAILGSLDDKIELNRRMNATLEEMARTLFRSWFVDFDPVKVKARGGDPVAELGLATEIAALFPDSFQDTTLGPIPTGWELGETNDLCKLNRQQVNPGAHPSEVYYHYSLPAFDESCRPKEELGAAIKSNKFGLESPSLLVSKLNPHIPRIWFVPNPVVGRSVASTEFLVLTPTTRTNLPYLYAKFSDPEFMRHLEELITGTSNSHRRVQPDVFMAQTEVLPPERVAAAYEAVAAPLLAQVEASRAQSRSLAEARDFLLPRLLSGSFRMEVA